LIAALGATAIVPLFFGTILAPMAVVAMMAIRIGVAVAVVVPADAA
jgi:hypothetical protein